MGGEGLLQIGRTVIAVRPMIQRQHRHKELDDEVEKVAMLNNSPPARFVARLSSHSSFMNPDSCVPLVEEETGHRHY